MPSQSRGKAAASDTGLVHVDDSVPGITRRRAGKGFTYFTANGRRLRDARTLERIRALAIPPAYTQVWICTKANGHLQATGRDARGRKQYRYHARWQALRDGDKFDRIIAFGQALPRLRRRLRRDLKLRGLPQDKVRAVVVALMADSLARVGNDAYARENRSYGLTTLRGRHLEWLRGGRARLKYRGKSGKTQEIEVDDKRLAKLVRACDELPGQQLFQYRDDDDTIRPVDSADINDYLHDAMDGTFTAKDFRTWGGTLRAFRAFADTERPEGASERALARLEKSVVAQVAQALGNTVAVCRKSYIDPAVSSGWRDGTLSKAASKAIGARQWEQALLSFLKRTHKAGRKSA